VRIGICSDIHVHRHDQADDIQDLVEHINASELDVLLCAGDLSHHPDEVRGFLQAISLECPRAWVPGNHDVWGIDAASPSNTADHRYRTVFPALSRETGWHYLPDAPLLIPGGETTVVGTLGWFTGPGYSEWFDASASDADEMLAARFAQELEQSILTSGAEQLIVVTHHVPHPDCLPEGGKRQAKHSTLLAEVIARYADRIALVVHGHKHRRYGPSLIDGLWYVAHPFGYPGQHTSHWDGLRVLDLDL